MDRTVAEVKCGMDAEQNVKASVALTFKVVRECLDILKGAVSIVYPMGLPEYDPVRMELENRDGSPNPFHHSFPDQPKLLCINNHMAYTKEYLHEFNPLNSQTQSQMLKGPPSSDFWELPAIFSSL